MDEDESESDTAGLQLSHHQIIESAAKVDYNRGSYHACEVVL